MTAVLDDAAVGDDEDPVRVDHRRQSVGDDQRAATLERVREGALDRGFRLRVEV